MKKKKRRPSLSHRVIIGERTAGFVFDRRTLSKWTSSEVRKSQELFCRLFIKRTLKCQFVVLLCCRWCFCLRDPSALSYMCQVCFDFLKIGVRGKTNTRMFDFHQNQFSRAFFFFFFIYLTISEHFFRVHRSANGRCGFWKLWPTESLNYRNS